MRNYLNKLRNHINQEMDFQTRLLILSVAGGVGCSFFAFVAAITSGLPRISVWSSFLCFLCMAGIAFYCYHTAERLSGKLLISVALNFILFPVLFFTSGGVDSGMPFYFLLGIYVIFITLRGALCFGVLAAALAADSIILWVGFTHKEWIVQIGEEARSSDVISSFFLVSVCIGVITKIVVSEYEKGNRKVLEWSHLLEEQARMDSLTGLYNRDYLMKTIRDWLEQEETGNISILFFDIDNFKKVNDTYGHLVGDHVLFKVAEIMKQEAGSDGMAGRYGGEELIVAFRDRTHEQAVQIGEAIRSRVNRGIKPAPEAAYISVSGGIAWNGEGIEAEELLAEADRKLYCAKAAGKNKIVY